ncbi:MAG TPA: NAD-dependent epimerase/dehydratase family protein [Candidatus Limnocylindrales bacterium]|nr:NAD-dependent epimerase/dehydratase family protein [Candidatus Limnocylindrales bacterium]
MSRVFLAGATGAIGRQLVPMLVADGHDVRGTTRAASRAPALTAAGAIPVVLDATDRAAVTGALTEARPDVVIHELTDLAGGIRPEDVSATSRLRQVATANLVDAMLAAGVRRLIAQSGAWLYAPGPVPHLEDDPLLDPATNPNHRGLPGILAVEGLTLGTPGIDGTVLRYGLFYGPGTVSAERADRPSVHIVAAAMATALAVAADVRGIFNIVDDGDDASNDRARSILGWDPDAR